MNTNRIYAIPLLVMLFGANGCKSEPPAEPAYTQVESAVGFDTKLESGPADLSEPTAWLISQESAGHIARLRMELGASTITSGNSMRIGFGKGEFLPVPGSDGTAFLPQLKGALQAKAMPAKVIRASNVPFTYAVLGWKTRREQDGSFGAEKTGNWIVLKLFFGDGDIEV